MSQVDTTQTVAFLDWLFGVAEPSWIHAWAQAPDGKLQKFFYVHDPKKLINPSWETSIAPKHNAYFCTSYVAQKQTRINSNGNDEAASGKAAKFADSIPAIWFDIDALKKFHDPRTQDVLVTGDEYFQDVRIQEDTVSAWVRSSTNGIQGYFKLDDIFAVNGNKALFDERMAPTMQDIAWYYGADLKVCHLSSMMRLPGTLNVKAEYKKPYAVTAEIYENRTTSIARLRERFKPDLDAVPRVVAYAIIKLMQEVWLDGQRNGEAMALAGSVRKAGIDKGSCRKLFKELTKAMHDDEDRYAQVDSTYDRDVDECLSYHSHNPELSPVLDNILGFWFDLKKAYAKARGLEWHPEDVDPTKTAHKSSANKLFFEREGATYWVNAKGDEELVANFTLRFTKRIIKVGHHAIHVLAQVTKQGGSPVLIELTPVDHSSTSKFASVKGLPSGIGFLQPSVWTAYIVYVDSEATDIATIKEVPYYGVLGGGSDKTVFLPGDDSAQYLWPSDRAAFDTAQENALSQEVTYKQARKYLQGLATHLPNYHETSYWVPALGWFCACPMTAFIREDQNYEGFPTLLITGRQGSGKSTLITQVISRHFGCKAPRSGASKGTTPYALKMGLSSNNVCPYVLDEFRVTEDGQAASAIQGIVRSLWAQYTSESGVPGGLVQNHYVTPACIIGESPYEDRATLDRTMSIRVNTDWVRSLRTKDNTAYLAARDYLHNPKLSGILGSLLLDYVSRNMDQVAEILEKSRNAVKKACKVKNARVLKNFQVTYAGIMLLDCLFRAHDVVFPLTRAERISAILAADNEVIEAKDSDESTLKQLFTATDGAIIDSIRKHAPHIGTLYVMDPKDPDIAYFQLARWYSIVNGIIKHSQSASLKNQRGFEDLIAENMHSDDPVIMQAHGKGFSQDAIAVNIRRVAQLYRIDTNAWRPQDE